MTLCVSTLTTSREPFSAWSETPNQVRTKIYTQHHCCLYTFTLFLSVNLTYTLTLFVAIPHHIFRKQSWGGLTETAVSSGIVVNGQVIGDKKIPPNGVINTYFSRFGILHQALGVRLEVSTQDISVFQDGKWIKILWSEAASLKGTKWEAQPSRRCLLDLMWLRWLLTRDALIPIFTVRVKYK